MLKILQTKRKTYDIDRLVFFNIKCVIFIFSIVTRSITLNCSLFGGHSKDMVVRRLHVCQHLEPRPFGGFYCTGRRDLCIR
jgi:hypothetical protein